jgi:indolepyruvate ferredoxin oxidoreductase beta subunit
METKNIMIVGVGGQGTLLTSRILGGVMSRAGYEVKVSEVHGMAQRGGSVVTYVRYGDKVYEPIVEEGQADVLIAFEKLEAVRYAHFLKKDGVIIVNEEQIDPMPVLTGAEEYPAGIIEKLRAKHEVFSIDAMKIALELGNARVFNMCLLGLAARHMSFTEDQWVDTIKEKVPPKTVDLNVKAFMTGYKG